jgi:hypothetical protein
MNEDYKLNEFGSKILIKAIKNAGNEVEQDIRRELSNLVGS